MLFLFLWMGDTHNMFKSLSEAGASHCGLSMCAPRYTNPYHCLKRLDKKAPRKKKLFRPTAHQQYTQIHTMLNRIETCFMKCFQIWPGVLAVMMQDYNEKVFLFLFYYGSQEHCCPCWIALETLWPCGYLFLFPIYFSWWERGLDSTLHLWKTFLSHKVCCIYIYIAFHRQPPAGQPAAWSWTVNQSSL